MDQEFARLYAEISIDGAGRDEVWKGAAALAQKFEVPKVEVLVRLAFATKPPPGGHQQEELEKAFAHFHQALSEAYPALTVGGRVDQILATAVLVQMFSSSSFAATAVTNTAFSGARKADVPVDLVTLAENAISRIAASRRQRPDLSKAKFEVPKLEFDAGPLLTQVPANSPLSLKPVFDELRDKINNSLADLGQRTNQALGKVIDGHKTADEELDMLSWVFGGRALMPDDAFGDLVDATLPLIVARDLASLTKIVPGPNAGAALMSRAGVAPTGALKVVDAVNAVSPKWTAAVLKGCKPSPASSPIHVALARREETGAGDGWQAGWSAVTGINVEIALTPLDLAQQFYREIIWLR